LVNVNTENLGSLVISHMAAPSTPHIYCSESGPMNMRTGSINYSSPEKSFLSIALAQMAKRYSLSSLVADCGWGDDTEACVSGVLTPATQLKGIMSGSDLVTGLGSIDSAKGISFEQFIFDSYMWDCCKNYLHEVEISEEKIGLESVKEVGHGYNFLTHPHTLRYLRGEIMFWEGEKLDLFLLFDSPLQKNQVNFLKAYVGLHTPPSGTRR